LHFFLSSLMNNRSIFNPLTPDRRWWNDAHNLNMLVIVFCTLSICLQYKMHRRRGGRPPAVHFMLQTNRKSVPKKLTSIVTFYASFHWRRSWVKGFISWKIFEKLKQLVQKWECQILTVLLVLWLRYLYLFNSGIGNNASINVTVKYAMKIVILMRFATWPDLAIIPIVTNTTPSLQPCEQCLCTMLQHTDNFLGNKMLTIKILHSGNLPSHCPRIIKTIVSVNK